MIGAAGADGRASGRRPVDAAAIGTSERVAPRHSVGETVSGRTQILGFVLINHDVVGFPGRLGRKGKV